MISNGSISLRKAATNYVGCLSKKKIERLFEVRSSGPCAMVTICTPVLQRVTMWSRKQHDTMQGLRLERGKMCEHNYSRAK